MLPSAPTASRGCAARRLQSRQLPRGASRPSRSSQRDVAGGRAERPRPNPSGERDPSSRPSRRLNIRESTRADLWTMPKDPRGGPIRPRELPRAQEDLPASSLVAPRSRERERSGAPCPRTAPAARPTPCTAPCTRPDWRGWCGKSRRSSSRWGASLRCGSRARRSPLSVPRRWCGSWRSGERSR